MPKTKVLCLKDKVKICEDSQKPGFSKEKCIIDYDIKRQNFLQSKFVLQIHENKKSFKCKIYEKTFYKVNLYHRFMRKKKPFKCKNYDKTFYKVNL